jgi:hypothetical protein
MAGICNNFELLHNFRITFPDFYRFCCFPLYSRGMWGNTNQQRRRKSSNWKFGISDSEKENTKSLQNITRPQGGIVKHYSSLGNGRKAICSSLRHWGNVAMPNILSYINFLLYLLGFLIHALHLTRRLSLIYDCHVFVLCVWFYVILIRFLNSETFTSYSINDWFRICLRFGNLKNNVLYWNLRYRNNDFKSKITTNDITENVI